jgi:RNA polymerase sigma-70 factor (ECF subfamily)
MVFDLRDLLDCVPNVPPDGKTASPVVQISSRHAADRLQSVFTFPVTRLHSAANYCMETSRSTVEAGLRTLMLRGLAGDAAAHCQLLAELAQLLRGYHQRRLGGRAADAEDLVQESLIAVHERRHTYDPSQPFTAWAYAVARRKLIDHLRRQRVRAALPLDDFNDLFVAPDDREARDATRDVTTLLSRLPPAQSAAIRLTRIEGYSIEEAAASTGQSESSIKVGVHRGLKKLARLLGTQGESS